MKVVLRPRLANGVVVVEVEATERDDRTLMHLGELKFTPYMWLCFAELVPGRDLDISIEDDPEVRTACEAALP